MRSAWSPGRSCSTSDEPGFSPRSPRLRMADSFPFDASSIFLVGGGRVVVAEGTDNQHTRPTFSGEEVSM